MSQGGRFTKGPLDLPLPVWAGGALTILAFIYGGIWLYGEWDAIAKGERDEERIEESLEKLKDYELIARAQVAEATRHLFETPGEGPGTYFEVVWDEGRTRLRHHVDDGCISVSRIDEEGRSMPAFIFTPERLEELRLEYKLELLGRASSAGISFAMSEAPSRIECEGSPGPGCCQSPHDPPWSDSTSEEERGIVVIDRRFSDDCRATIAVNWQKQEAGPQVWVKCYHPGEPTPGSDDDDSSSDD